MPSTYTLNNGIELIATGEQSGTWGDTTNTNLSLIDVSLDGQVSITLPSAGTSGSPNTLDIQDGTASNGRNRFIIFNDGGDLGSSAFVQLTPNDAEKIVYIRNNLSGSRSILVFQGTYNASNDYEIPSGTTAVVYFDGAGAGAVAANVFNNAYFDSLRLGSVSVTSILDEDNMGSDSATALATQQSIKAYVDSQVTAQDLDFAGDSGTGAVDLDSQSLTIAGTANEIETSASGQTLTVGLPDNVTITGTATAAGLIVASDSTYAIDVSRPSAGNTTLRITGGSTAGNDAVLRADIANTTGTSAVYFGDTDTNGIGRIMYEHNGDYMRFYTSSTEKMRIDSSGNVGIGTTSPDRTLSIKASSTTNIPLTVESGSAQTTSFIAIRDPNTTSPYAVAVGSNTDDLLLRAGGAERMRIDSSGNVGIGTDSPTGKLNVYSGDSGATTDGSADELFLEQAGNSGLTIGTPNTSTASIFFADPESSSAGRIQYLHASDSLTFGTAATERMRIDSSGNVGIGTSSPSGSLDVVADSSARAVRLRGRAADNIADLNFSSNDNVTLYGAFSSRGNGDFRWQLSSATGSAQIWTNNTERMRIDSSGNVGIGTASPVKRLTISGASNGNITTLTDAATITPDLDSSDMFTVTLGGNRTLANPSNIDAGQTGSIFIVQDGTGSRTLAWGSYWDFAGGTAPTLSTAAGAVDRVDFIVRTSTSIHTVFTANYS